jgi:hypothetical protein
MSGIPRKADQPDPRTLQLTTQNDTGKGLQVHMPLDLKIYSQVINNFQLKRPLDYFRAGWGERLIM